MYFLFLDLLQYTYADFYLHVISDQWYNHTDSMVQSEKFNYASSAEWFVNQSYGFKTGTLLILIVLCWPIQKYFQDGFISSLYAKYFV